MLGRPRGFVGDTNDQCSVIGANIVEQQEQLASYQEALRRRFPGFRLALVFLSPTGGEFKSG
jgi:hypothetical protein